MYHRFIGFERCAYSLTFDDIYRNIYWYIEAGLREALPHLLMAESDYTTLSMFEATSDVQWLLMLVYHNLGMREDEESVLGRHSNSISTMRSFEECTLDEEAQQVWNLVTDIGLSLVAR